MREGRTKPTAMKEAQGKGAARSQGTTRGSEPGRVDRLRDFLANAFTPTVLFVVVLAIGVWARVWEFGQLPPGLNQDEASIGVEAYDLLHYGIDRNGISYPVNFVSWGYGMDALYGYVLMPFMLLGLSPLTVRLPNLLAGLATLPLVYIIARRSIGATGGLLAMFLLAVSPWHILLSRWGLNDNILPVVFALGVACAVMSTRGNAWFIAASLLLGLSLYAYGAAYVAVPVFLACAVPVLLRSGRLSTRQALIGLTVFGAAALPIVLFILINALGWSTIHLGALTIPRLPVQARFLDMAATSSADWMGTLVENAWVMVKLLLIHPSDGMAWNAVDPFGYLYAFTFPLAVAGAVMMLRGDRSEARPEQLLVLAWLSASLCIGLIQSVNINRIGLIFIPLILCTAAFLVWIWRHSRAALAVLIILYLLSFGAFQAAYHGTEYRKQARSAFAAGMLPALEYARQKGDQPVCVTDRVIMPYIYVLFSEHGDPQFHLQSIRYKDPGAAEREVLSLGRYSFGLENCRHDAATIYVLSDEMPPGPVTRFKMGDFGIFRVYVP